MNPPLELCLNLWILTLQAEQPFIQHLSILRPTQAGVCLLHSSPQVPSCEVVLVNSCCIYFLQYVYYCQFWIMVLLHDRGGRVIKLWSYGVIELLSYQVIKNVFEMKQY